MGFLCSQDIEHMSSNAVPRNDRHAYYTYLLCSQTGSIVPLDLICKILLQRLLRISGQQQQSIKRRTGWTHRFHTQEPNLVYTYISLNPFPLSFKTQDRNFWILMHQRTRLTVFTEQFLPTFLSFIFTSLTLRFASQSCLESYSAVLHHHLPTQSLPSPDRSTGGGRTSLATPLLKDTCDRFAY